MIMMSLKWSEVTNLQTNYKKLWKIVLKLTNVCKMEKYGFQRVFPISVIIFGFLLQGKLYILVG